MGTLTDTPSSQQTREQEFNELYWKDGYSWAIQQADALRRRDFTRVDWDNVIEEIEDLAKREARSLRSQYARAIEHLLKIEYRREKENLYVNGWERIVNSARGEMEDILLDNPVLKGASSEIFARAWVKGRKAAARAFTDYDTEEIPDAAQRHRERKRSRRKWNNTLPTECPYDHWIPERNRITERPRTGRPFEREQEFDWGR